MFKPDLLLPAWLALARVTSQHSDYKIKSGRSYRAAW